MSQLHILKELLWKHIAVKVLWPNQEVIQDIPYSSPLLYIEFFWLASASPSNLLPITYLPHLHLTLPLFK